MKKILPGKGFRVGLSVLGLCALFAFAWALVGHEAVASSEGETGTLEKMIVAQGRASIDVDMTKLYATKSRQMRNTVTFDVEPDSYFKVLVFNGELRGTLPSSMNIKSADIASLPGSFASSRDQIVLESLPFGGDYELAIRDQRSGFTYFNIQGQEPNYDPSTKVFSVRNGRLILSPEYAAELGRPTAAGTHVGDINFDVDLRPIEVTRIVNGEVESGSMPTGSNAGTVPGPDVIVGDLSGLAQFGSASGTQVGLAVGTDSCNAGTVDLNWFANPSNDHPVIPQNLYRMTAGGGKFEQVGQGQMKHAFTALTNNLCGFGCNGVGGSRLGSGCSDPYGASLNAGPNLGSKAWVNPYTGFYPRNDSATPNNSHTGHTHLGPTHRILTEINDLSTTLNPGATYFAEGQYVTPHEYAWCQTNPTQCNMNNNVSYRQYNVNGTASPFSFSAAGSTQREKPAIMAWTGATIVQFKPDAGNDGIGFLGYKVTNPSPGVWHYEYAIYNQNIDRAIQSFGIPIGNGVTLSNVAFYAPPQHPGSTADGTAGNAGFSSAAWTQTETGGYTTWGSESLLVNPNANAIRWGSMYNIRFDSNRPPMTTFARLGFLKTGSPISVRVQVPQSGDVTCSRIPQGNRC
ncbi:MAG: hypothetical protein JNL64_05800 [Blastocatellia bacterium]|nr:hypothetical protein [Blastocatellia bacterium]